MTALKENKIYSKQFGCLEHLPDILYCEFWRKERKCSI